MPTDFSKPIRRVTLPGEPDRNKTYTYKFIGPDNLNPNKILVAYRAQVNTAGKWLYSSFSLNDFENYPIKVTTVTEEFPSDG